MPEDEKVWRGFVRGHCPHCGAQLDAAELRDQECRDCGRTFEVLEAQDEADLPPVPPKDPIHDPGDPEVLEDPNDVIARGDAQ